MWAKVTDRCRVWKIEDRNSYAEVQFSVSRKVKDNNRYDTPLIEHQIAKNGYVSSSWSFIRFIGKAYNKLKEYGDITGKDITNLNMAIEQEPYWSEQLQSVAYPKSPRFSVYDFDIYTNENNRNGIDSAPIVEEETVAPTMIISDDDLPF